MSPAFDVHLVGEDRRPFSRMIIARDEEEAAYVVGSWFNDSVWVDRVEERE